MSSIDMTKNQEGVMNAMMIESSKPDLTDVSPQVATPDYLIQIEKFTKSQIKGATSFCQLNRYQEMIGHTVSHPIAGTLFSSGSITASHVAIWLPFEGWTANLVTAMTTGKQLKEIKIRKVASIQKPNVVTMEIVYSTCYIIDCRPDHSQRVFSFRFAKRKETFTQYDQMGKKKGKTSSSLDLAKGTAGK